MKFLKKIRELENRVAALENKATATTWSFGKIDFPTLARIVDKGVAAMAEKRTENDKPPIEPESPAKQDKKNEGRNA